MQRKTEKKQQCRKQKKGIQQSKVKAAKHGSKEAAAAFFVQWQERNESGIAEYNAAMDEANIGKANAYNAKARATSLNALPRWADLKAIEMKYVEAARLGLVVDHVVPLKGRFVCGLHVEGNLELRSQEANLRKGNRFVDDS